MSVRGKVASLGLVAIVGAAMIGCENSADKEISRESAAALELLQSHAGTVMKLRPSYATRMGLTDEDLGVRVNDAMDDYSVEQLGTWRREVDQMREELRALPASDLHPLTRRAMEEIYTSMLGAREVPFGFVDTFGRHRPYIINQIDQPLQELPKLLTTFQRVETREDVADYLRRLWALSALVTTVLDKFNFDANAGWLPPRPILVGSLEYIDGFTAVDPAEHKLVTGLLERIDASGALSEDERGRARNEAIAVLIRVVYPSYRNAAIAVRERLKFSDNDAGIWAQPLGEKFYRVAIRNEAGSSKSPDEIHKIGLSEVSRILEEMDAGLKVVGLAEGSVAERMQMLARDERFLFEDSDEGRAKLLAKIQGTVEDMERRLPNYFGKLPPQPVAVKPVPVELQAGSAMGYYDGPPATGGPGVFWLNMRSMADLPWFSMPTLTYHETVPGHHLQIALARLQTGKPLLWRYTLNSAYSEGWALYAEYLAAEMGVYHDDPYGDLGRLRDELHRAVRLVVDTGLHAKRWPMDRAVTYMQQTTGKGEREVRAEVLRYMAWPGQALSYKLGMMDLQDMRAEARAQLGDAFSLSDFHDIVLGTGQVTMPVLRDEVRAWSKP